MFRAIPFLAIIVIAYNVIALLTGPALSSAVMSATLPSGAAWTLTVGDLIVTGPTRTNVNDFRAVVVTP